MSGFFEAHRFGRDAVAEALRVEEGELHVAEVELLPRREQVLFARGEVVAALN